MAEDLSHDTENLRRCLERIRLRAGLHFLGQAFDPEHMFDLATMAEKGLAGERFPPLLSSEEALIQAREKYGWLFDAEE